MESLPTNLQETPFPRCTINHGLMTYDMEMQFYSVFNDLQQDSLLQSKISKFFKNIDVYSNNNKGLTFIDLALSLKLKTTREGLLAYFLEQQELYKHASDFKLKFVNQQILQNKDVGCFNLLLDHNIIRINRDTIHFALETSKTRDNKKFEEVYRVELECPDEKGNTLLHSLIPIEAGRSIDNKTFQIIKAICNITPSVLRKKNCNGETPLALAIRHDHAKVVEQLLEVNPDLEQIAEDTPNLIQLLLDRNEPNNFPTRGELLLIITKIDSVLNQPGNKKIKEKLTRYQSVFGKSPAQYFVRNSNLNKLQLKPTISNNGRVHQLGVAESTNFFLFQRVISILEETFSATLYSELLVCYKKLSKDNGKLAFEKLATVRRKLICYLYMSIKKAYGAYLCSHIVQYFGFA